MLQRAWFWVYDTLDAWVNEDDEPSDADAAERRYVDMFDKF